MVVSFDQIVGIGLARQLDSNLIPTRVGPPRRLLRRGCTENALILKR